MSMCFTHCSVGSITFSLLLTSILVCFYFFFCFFFFLFIFFVFFFFFFFQAEDGIRDRTVTGVQTCALPIYCLAVPSRRAARKNIPRGSRRPSPANLSLPRAS